MENIRKMLMVEIRWYFARIAMYQYKYSRRKPVESRWEGPTVLYFD